MIDYSTTKPLVSIIVPVYKVERYLRQCVESLLYQTLKNIEIILVDDGSPDNCSAMCDSYAEKDERVRVIHQHNGGYGKACNAGLAVARGEYIGIVESDDYVELEMFDVLYSIAQNTSSPIIKGSFFHEYQNGTNDVCSLKHITNNSEICQIQAKNNLYLMLYESSIWSAIYSRDFIVSNKIKMFETRGASYQDVIWKFETYAMAECITLIDKPVYHYRVMAEGSSSKSGTNYDVMFVNYAEIRNFLDFHGKFGQYKNSYYLHQFFDAVFHLGRLKGYYKKSFTIMMRKVIEEAKREGITIDSFPGYSIPLSIRTVYNEIESGRRNILKRAIKHSVFFFYRSRAGSFLWAVLKKIANTRYIQIILKKLLNVPNNAGNYITLGQIYFPAAKKNALILMPFWTQNAACLNVSCICEALRNAGYSLNLIVYHPHETAPSEPFWDHTYTIRPNSSSFGVSHPAGRDKTKLDANLIDDWVGDDLLSFVRILNQNCHFDLCLCNYVFLSKALVCFNDRTKKVIFTHDVYTGRNERLYSAGIHTYYFGTSQEEEKKGLERADLILAVQKKEQLLFQNLISKPVITLPYVPKKKYVSNSFTGLPLKVGYIASYHAPNILSIQKYIDLLKNENNILIYIAGSISPAINKNLPNVYIMGLIDSLDVFYSQCDLYINPDTLESGLKIKTVQAFSYGVPFLCTKESSAGIDVEKPYHRAESIEQLAELTKKCIDNPVMLNEMAQESRHVYDGFYNAYPVDEIICKMIS